MGGTLGRRQWKDGSKVSNGGEEGEGEGEEEREKRGEREREREGRREGVLCSRSLLCANTLDYMYGYINSAVQLS